MVAMPWNRQVQDRPLAGSAGVGIGELAWSRARARLRSQCRVHAVDDLADHGELRRPCNFTARTRRSVSPEGPRATWWSGSTGTATGARGTTHGMGNDMDSPRDLPNLRKRHLAVGVRRPAGHDIRALARRPLTLDVVVAATQRRGRIVTGAGRSTRLDIREAARSPVPPKARRRFRRIGGPTGLQQPQCRGRPGRCATTSC